MIKKSRNLHFLVPRLALLIAGVATSGCFLPDYRSTPAATFAEALSVCRFKHSGRTNRKLALPPTEEHVEGCLARRGWSPSGERLPEAAQ